VVSAGEKQAFMDYTNVSRETFTRFSAYETLLKKWNPVINLVSTSTLSHVWTRHFLDSAQIWALRPENTRRWLDLGSGGGFPGMIIAILAADHTPNLSVTLVESDARKAAFLASVKQKLGISVEICIERAEDLAPHGADVVSARALAPLSTLLGYSALHTATDGVGLFPKGKNHEIELTKARKYWTFTEKQTPSRTDPDGVILTIRGPARVADTKNR